MKFCGTFRGGSCNFFFSVDIFHQKALLLKMHAFTLLYSLFMFLLELLVQEGMEFFCISDDNLSAFDCLSYHLFTTPRGAIRRSLGMRFTIIASDSGDLEEAQELETSFPFVMLPTVVTPFQHGVRSESLRLEVLHGDPLELLHGKLVVGRILSHHDVFLDHHMG